MITDRRHRCRTHVISDSCEGTLPYEGIQDNAFTFEGTVESGGCCPSTVAVVPMPGGPYAIAVEEAAAGHGWVTFGALLNEDYCFGYPERPHVAVPMSRLVRSWLAT